MPALRKKDINRMKRLRRMDLRDEYRISGSETDKRIRVNIYLRPWILDYIDDLRTDAGMNRSRLIDVLLGWMVQDMIADQTKERQFGDGVPEPLYKQKSPEGTRASRKEDDSALPYPDMEVNFDETEREDAPDR